MPFLPTIENCLHLRQPWIRQFHEIGPLIKITRRALILCNNVPLRTRRALLPKTLYSDSTLLVLNGTSLNSINLMPYWLSTWRYTTDGYYKPKKGGMLSGKVRFNPSPRRSRPTVGKAWTKQTHHKDLHKLHSSMLSHSFKSPFDWLSCNRTIQGHTMQGIPCTRKTTKIMRLHSVSPCPFPPRC